MDDSWAEVERMAQATDASDAQESSLFPTEEQISRWQMLFGYTRRETLDFITAQRSDFTRTRITDEHWEAVKEGKTHAGHDEESYEHCIELSDVMKRQSATIVGPDGNLRFLIRLGGVLGTAEKVREVLRLSDGDDELNAGYPVPSLEVVDGQSERGISQFCIVDEEAKGSIEKWLTQAQVGMGK